MPCSAKYKHESQICMTPRILRGHPRLYRQISLEKLLRSHAVRRAQLEMKSVASPLTGKLFDESGQNLTPRTACSGFWCGLEDRPAVAAILRR
jgi:hypothetical protein